METNSADTRLPGSDSEEQPPEARSGPGRLLAIGCGSMVALLLVVTVILFFTWPRIMASVFRGTVVHTLSGSNLGDEEKERVLVVVDRVLAEFLDDTIEDDELKALIEDFDRCPLSRVFMVFILRASHLEQSGLSATEKEVAGRRIDRLVRGIMEKKIDDDDLKGLQEFFRRDESGMMMPRESLNDSEFRDLMDEITALVDGKEISDADYEPPIAEELERFVEETLGRKPGNPEPQPEGQ